MTTTKAVQGESVRFWARFAIRSTMEAGLVRVLAGSECEPFERLIDITDVCVENRISAEVWFETGATWEPYGRVAYEGERVPANKRTGWSGARRWMGWVDELGRVHARAENERHARAIAGLLGPDADRYDLENRTVTIHGEDHLVAIEVWATVQRRRGEDATPGVYTCHRFMVGEVRIG